jgi:virulence-associated protein VapD
VYAICFDLDTAEAERHHPTNSETGTYGLIERVFQDHGFERRQGSVYFGGPKTTSVDCVLAVQELVKRHPWIRFAVRDIRMLRVEETNDLMPALGRQADLFDNVSGM